jgi:hypothetical protein
MIVTPTKIVSFELCITAESKVTLPKELSCSQGLVSDRAVTDRFAATASTTSLVHE